MVKIQLQNSTEPQFLTANLDLQRASISEFFDELRALVPQLGLGGGSLTPSIYDTAQVLRFAPPEEGIEAGLDWLLKQQETDGGWGNPIAPLMRDVPTLAAVLALHQYDTDGQYAQAIHIGLEFLKQQSGQWLDFSLDELLVGVELILPGLVEEAIQKKLDIAYPPYLKLDKVGSQKRKMIQHLKVVHGTPAAFSWEAWGESPERFLLDPIFSVGNSTSATAAWIAKARAVDSSANVNRSLAYLRSASDATGLAIPGVVPFAWPINRFEQSFSLYALATGGLLTHPALEDVVKPQVFDLYEALTPFGMPFSDYFIPDLDDTAAAIVVFRTYGREVQPEVLKVFKNAKGYFTYPGEFHASTSAHARAVQALSHLADEEVPQAQQVLLPFQNTDGVWPGDKWHKSWLYTTSHMLYALSNSPRLPAVEKGLSRLLDAQHTDGGWGIGFRSTTAETAYVMLALQLYRKERPGLEWSYRRGQTWLLNHIYREPIPHENLWIGKELFKPYRIDRAFELTALLQSFLVP